jgi:hypothetical protein
MLQFRVVVILCLLTLGGATPAIAEEQPVQAQYAAAAARLGSDDFQEATERRSMPPDEVAEGSAAGLHVQ